MMPSMMWRNSWNWTSPCSVGSRRACSARIAHSNAIRAESASYLRRSQGKHVGFKALRDIISDIVGDAQSEGTLSARTDPQAAVNAIYALTRGLTEEAANLPAETSRATGYQPSNS